MAAWLRRLGICTLPFVLILLEWVIRHAVGDSPETASFIGPSLAAAGIGLELPLMIPKEIRNLNPQIKRWLQDTGHGLRNNNDDSLIALTTVLMLWGLGAWAYALLLIVSPRVEDLMLGGLRESAWIGLAVYVPSIVLTEVKEHL